MDTEETRKKRSEERGPRYFDSWVNEPPDRPASAEMLMSYYVTFVYRRGRKGSKSRKKEREEEKSDD